MILIVTGGERAEAAATSKCGGTIDADNALVIGQFESRCGWPFFADEVVFVCVKATVPTWGDLQAVYVIAKGKAFALNGHAKTRGAPRLFELGNPKTIAASEYVTASWIKVGLDLCERGGSRL